MRGTVTLPILPKGFVNSYLALTGTNDRLYTAYSVVNNQQQALQAELAVVDTLTLSVVHQFSLPRAKVIGFVISPDGSTGFITFLDPGNGVSLDKYNLQTGQLLKTLHVVGSIEYPSNTVLSPDASILYISVAGNLLAVDTATLTERNTSSGTACNHLSLTPAGDYLYASETGKISIISTASLQSVGTIPNAALFYVNPIVLFSTNRLHRAYSDSKISLKDGKSGSDRPLCFLLLEQKKQIGDVGIRS